MLVIELRFPASRYHATPWGRHVNEGEVEWPPSPWRLVRALLATWHRKAFHELSEVVVRRLIDKLCADPPHYSLPPVSSGHTRHYMALYNTARDEKTARVFDVFLHLDEPAQVVWPSLSLSEDESKALALLLDRLAYLGRAESWVEAAIKPSTDLVASCRPLGGEVVGRGAEVVKLLVPQASQAFLDWRSAQVSGNGKPSRGKGPNLPADLFEALHADTGDLRRDGWSQPPGSRFIEYVRPRPEAPRATQKRARRELPTVARFAVTSPVPPLLTHALSFADRVHRTLVKHSDGLELFTGLTQSGDKLQGHRHAYIFCEANGKDQRSVTHVTLWAPDGFDREAERALDNLRRVYSRGDHTARLVLLGLGMPGQFAGADTRAGQCPIFAQSRVWVSRTPFVPTRHAKPRKFDTAGRVVGSPEHDLLRLLLHRGDIPEPTRIDPLDHADLGGHRTSWLDFRTVRHDGGGARAGNRGFGFRLEFPDSVRGPIAVGYGAHFGLGLFVPARE